MTITNDIRYVGVNDHQVDLFEGQYRVPNGMSLQFLCDPGRKDRRHGYGGQKLHPPVAGQYPECAPGPEGRTIWWCSIWSRTTPPICGNFMKTYPGGHRRLLCQGLHDDERLLRYLL